MTRRVCPDDEGRDGAAAQEGRKRKAFGKGKKRGIKTHVGLDLNYRR